MITLFTTLFTGIYWLFTNIVLLPSISAQNGNNILLLGIVEILTELMLVIFITSFVEVLKEKKEKKRKRGL